MKKLVFSLMMSLFAISLSAQTICNSLGNLMIYTNYDGGSLNINVDANIPNLKIGIVSYEAVSVVLSGPYVSNVVAVAYAGFQGANNTHCGTTLAATTIVGAPVGVTPTIVSYPPSPLSNSYGNASIICGYSCSTTTYQGGCNTVDQIEAYFTAFFPGSALYAHMVQYGCWTVTQNISTGGNCCNLFVGLDETKTENIVTVAPNPFSTSTNLLFAQEQHNTNVIITDVMGKEIKKLQVDGSQLILDRNDLKSGIYFLHITNEIKPTVNMKIVIQ